MPITIKKIYDLDFIEGQVTKEDYIETSQRTEMATVEHHRAFKHIVYTKPQILLDLKFEEDYYSNGGSLNINYI